MGRLTFDAAAAQKDRRLRGGRPSAVVEAVLLQKLRLRDPEGFGACGRARREQRPIGGDRRVVPGRVPVERGLLHDRPGLQVDDRQVALEVVPAERREVLAVRADRARHEPGTHLSCATRAVAVEDALPQRRDPLVRRQQDAVGVGLADLLVAERVEPTGEGGCDAHHGDARCKRSDDHDPTASTPTRPQRHELPHAYSSPRRVVIDARLPGGGAVTGAPVGTLSPAPGRRVLLTCVHFVRVR